jgi:hypothetical protein
MPNVAEKVANLARPTVDAPEPITFLPLKADIVDEVPTA